MGCTFDHRIADAYSANMFFVSWAELARCKQSSVIPSFRRSLLNPRRPGSFHPSLNGMYAPIASLPPPPPGGADHDHPLISRIYYVTAEQLLLLQTLATTNCNCKGSSSYNYKRTKLESFSAFLWKMMAETESDDKKICKMGIVVDGRKPLSHDKLSSYFGNVLSIPFGEKTSQELKEQPLSWVADEVHDYLKAAATKEHFLGLIDWVEAHRPQPAITKIYSSDGPAFVVSSGQRFPAAKVDFGWGRPALGSYHFPWGGEAGYVMPMPSPNPARDGDWLVYMHLFKRQIDFIETEASHLFKPLTSQYLNLLP